MQALPNQDLELLWWELQIEAEEKLVVECGVYGWAPDQVSAYLGHHVEDGLSQEDFDSLRKMIQRVHEQRSKPKGHGAMLPPIRPLLPGETPGKRLKR